MLVHSCIGTLVHWFIDRTSEVLDGRGDPAPTGKPIDCQWLECVEVLLSPIFQTL